MKLVFILLDAFRHDYIDKDHTPFLYKLAKNNKYYKKITPSYGYCERTEIYTGKKSLELGLFTSLGYDPKNSPYKNYFLLNILDKIEKIFNFKILSKLIRRFIWLIYRNKNFTYFPAKIPLNLLKFFALTEDGKDSFIENHPLSIFNLYKNKIFNETNTSLTNNKNLKDDARLKLVLNNINKDDITIYPIYISYLDYMGHMYGPNSYEIKLSLKYLDTKLKFFYNKLNEKNKNLSFILCGDHGMANVKNKINIIELISDFKKKYLIEDKNMIYFVDSTLCRFWFIKDKEKNFKKLKEFISLKVQTQYGFLILNEQYADYGIPKDRKYGDCLFLTTFQTILYPDYYNYYEVKGMHGYNSENSEMSGCAIIVNKKVNNTQTFKEKKLYEIYDEIISILE